MSFYVMLTVNPLRVCKCTEFINKQQLGYILLGKMFTSGVYTSCVTCVPL